MENKTEKEEKEVRNEKIEGGVRNMLETVVKSLGLKVPDKELKEYVGKRDINQFITDKMNQGAGYTTSDIAKELKVKSTQVNGKIGDVEKKLNTAALVHVKSGRSTLYALIPKDQLDQYKNLGFTPGKHKKNCPCEGTSVNLDNLFEGI